MKECSPLAVYVHCFGHLLNLAPTAIHHDISGIIAKYSGHDPEPVIALSQLLIPLILTRSFSRQTNACSTDSRKHVHTAAEVIDVLLENSLNEMTPEFLQVASILAVIPATPCSAERSFSELREWKTYLRNTMRQHRLSVASLSSVLSTSMDKMIDTFGKRHARKNFFF